MTFPIAQAQPAGTAATPICAANAVVNMGIPKASLSITIDMSFPLKANFYTIINLQGIEQMP